MFEFVYLARSDLVSTAVLRLVFGSEGKEPGQLNSPWGLCCVDGAVFVADKMNNRIQVFTEDGKFVREFGSKNDGPSSLYHPTDLCYDETQNEIFVVCSRKKDSSCAHLEMLAKVPSGWQLTRRLACCSCPNMVTALFLFFVETARLFVVSARVAKATDSC